VPDQPLVVVALRQEAACLTGVDVLLTGIGKVAAATAVASTIATRRPSAVLNVGTAGALRDGLTGTHRIGRVLEHDLDHDALAALIGEPVVGEIVLDPSAPTVLATGDAFVQGGHLRSELAVLAHLVDMEGFAVARACEAAGVPCTMIKVVSDDASAGAAKAWVDQVAVTARTIADIVTAELSRR
jgi:adenosylhomocysteine nucleosidase